MRFRLLVMGAMCWLACDRKVNAPDPVAERMKRQAAIEVTLPPGGEPVLLNVVVDANGTIFVDGFSTDANGLKKAAAQFSAERGAEARAIITADERAPHARQLEVMDLLKAAGVTKFALSIQAAPGR